MPPQRDETMQAVPAANASKANSPTNAATTNAASLEKEPVFELPADHPSKLGWWRCGGMHINLNGMGINIYGSLYFLMRDLPMEQIKTYIGFLLACVTLSALGGMRTMYCILIVPTFMTSMILSLTLDVNNLIDTSPIADMNIPILSTILTHPAILLLPALAIAIAKVNICMSVCLHRYAAHNAFKCGPITDFFINALGCCAIQGGPIWWASQHRLHHKHCDMPRDPHSCLLSGIEKAFAFFEMHEGVVEEFVPRHLESPMHRILDTWSWLVVLLELNVAYYLFGLEGLFISFTSGWICQSITLWFNIVNHPPSFVGQDKDGKEVEVVCKATDVKMGGPGANYLPYYFLDFLHPIFGWFVMEMEHKHHHDNAMLAKRSWYDPAYWFFVKPLEVVGLVWDVKVGEF
jgi:fatty-acid desaturase